MLFRFNYHQTIDNIDVYRMQNSKIVSHNNLIVPARWEFLGVVNQNDVQRTTYLIQKQNNKKQSLAVFRDFLEQEIISSKTEDIFRICVKMRVE